MSGRRVAVQIAKAAVSVGLIAFLFYKLSPGNLIAQITVLAPGPLVAATAVFFASVVMGALQWHLLLAAGGIAMPFAQTCRVYFVGLFFNNFLPAGIGGDVVKIYDVTRIGNDPYQVFAVTMLDRVIGIAGLCILAIIASVALLGGGGLDHLGLYVVIFAGCVAPLLALVVNRRLSRQVRTLFGGIAFMGLGRRFDAIFRRLGEYRRLRALLARLTLLAVSVQFLRVVTHILVARSLGVPVTPQGFLQFFVFVPLLGLVMILPISINGLGVREGVGILLFTQIGFSKEQALIMELMTYAIMVAVSLVGGFFFLRRSIERRGAVEPREAGNNV